MTSALKQAVSEKSLHRVWDAMRRRLCRSCFGVDRQTGRDFSRRIQQEFALTRTRLADKKFAPRGLLAIAKPKDNGAANRIICVPTIADRFIQFALLDEFRPSLEKKGLLNPISYGLIRSAGRGVGHARLRALQLRTNAEWVLKADIVKFFDNIPRNAVDRVCRRVVPQRSLHPAILAFIHTEIQDGFDPNWREVVRTAGIVEGRGVRQGMPLSPYFAGMVLLDLDRKIEKLGFRAIRYVDDIVGFFQSEVECDEFAGFLTDELKTLGMNVGIIGATDSKTRKFKPKHSAEFLGMDIAWSNGKYTLQINDKCLQKVAAKMAQASSLDFLLQKKITLPRLGSYLDAVERGYSEAYSGAENIDILKNELSAQKNGVISSVLEEVLGIEKVSSLTMKHKKFLGLAA